MKKIGAICLALVLALGGLGAVYAMWSEELVIDTTVQTGEVCLEMYGLGEVKAARDSDWNWDTWEASGTAHSCPSGYTFGEPVNAGKDVAWIDWEPDEDGDTEYTHLYSSDENVRFDSLYVVIRDAYPYYLGEISVQVHNCGTIPVILAEPVMTQDYPGLLVELRDSIGEQYDPSEAHEVSFYIGVMQEALQSDDESYVPLTFSITITGNQWNE